jgi:hypothetical protein
MEYATLTGTLKGTGLQTHQLIEKRFAGVMGPKILKALGL